MVGRWLARWLAGAFLAALAALPVSSAEEIVRFVSDVEVRTNGDFLVTETIEVRAEGQNIRRGIYRDFPTAFVDRDGKTAATGFELISARRDGQPETARVERGGSFVRVYLGREDVYLAPGLYRYELTYRTDRQVRFFADHDEIYWNATGTEWIFPIRLAEAIIRLPEGARAGQTAAYTGPFGSRAQEARSSISADGRTVSFVTTRPLDARAGLSVVVAIPRGVVQPPTADQRAAWFLRDNLATLIAAGGTLAVFAYYLLTWMRIGRDPPRGVIVPRWDAPQGVSPALAHYIWNRGLRGQGFQAIAASALNLAVGGYIEIEDIDKAVTLRRTSKGTDGIVFPVGEGVLLDRLEGRDAGLALSQANGTTVAAIGQLFRHAMEKEHRAVYYHHNRGWIFLGVALSAAVLAATLLIGRPNAGSLAALPVALFGGVIFTVIGTRMAKQWGRGLSGKLGLVFLIFVAGIFVVNTGLWSAARVVLALEDPALIGAIASLLMINLLSFYLLGAPTPLGSRRMDEIEGLRHYLSVAEEDRMHMAGAPRMSPRHFETLLPYAVALDLEKPWSGAFNAWLARAVAAGTVAQGAYAPGWYHGTRATGPDLADRMASLGGSLSDSFTRALPAPKSSSSGFSGGGGSSGGGGGGGGGGGW